MTDYLTIALVLFAIGVILLLAEILLPTGGILVVASLLFFSVGVGIILRYGDTIEAAVAVGGLAVGLPAAGFVAVHAWRRMSIGSSLDATTGAPVDLAGTAELESLRGRTGRTASPMRPSGTVEFDGRRVDAMTEGIMLEAGVWVKCVDVRGGKVLVRKMEAGGDVSDINLDEPRPARDLDDLDLGLDNR
jgi:membrane-bound serine protease (ClpP class)